MKLAQFVADFIASISPRVYGVVGAGAMHLNDAICHHPGIQFIAMHHEQAAATAAEADARVTNKIGVVHVTAGPGGTNAITGVAGAYVDSIPMLVIAGQVTTSTMRAGHGLRQFGTNELPVADLMGPITKWSLTITNPERIRYVLERALGVAMSGRRGPVFVEIPLDVQAAEVDPAEMIGYEEFSGRSTVSARDLESVFHWLSQAQRPLILVGNGIHLAGAEDDLARLVALSGIPVVTSWNGIDLLDSDDNLVIGRPGVMGDRAGNFAVQNCDCLLAIGTRMSIPQTGHAQNLYAPNARMIVVDIDGRELSKPIADRGADVRSQELIGADAGDFLREALKLVSWRDDLDAWRARCLEWKQSYPVMLPEYRESKNGVNAYAFIEELGKHLDDDAIVVTDVGAAYQATHQSLQLKRGQRLFHSGGVSAMGVGIPLAVGAKLAGGNRQVVCLVGDGGAMVNIQELETIARLGLDIKIFVFCNDGYQTMQYTQKTHFGRESASSSASGFRCANFGRLATEFGLERENIRGSDVDGDIINDVLKHRGPALCEVHLPENQILAPRLQSKLNDKGEFILPAFDDMWPHLSPDELARARGATSMLQAAE